MTTPLQHFAVLGAGSWGTAFAKVLADAGRQVSIWCRRASLAQAMTEDRINSEYLPTITLPAQITITSDIDESLVGAQAVVLAIPSQALREALAVFRDILPRTGPIISLAKGVEVGTGQRMSQIISQVGRIAPERIVAVSGPNLAREIAAGQPTTTVFASDSLHSAQIVQAASANPYFRPYTSNDIIGVEIAGTGKNVVAMACGIADGLGLGDNTHASILTRGLRELTELGIANGGQAATFAGLSGIGDLVATCSSPLSRNRSLGFRLGQGMALDEAIAAGNGQVAEGVASCRSLRFLAQQHQVDMPIAEGVFRVCYQQKPPQEMIRMLMEGPHSAE